ncbi:MAG: phenylalanine 4-monooxygenase [Halobacteriovoraceae bacterium]|nr:phenylalanine 4-monooxygenase [Halobacteriovoraceae bacterium]
MGKVSKYQSKKPNSQGIVEYTDQESKTWEYLVQRQNVLIQSRACKEFIDGVDILNFGKKIPQHFEITEIIKSKTGWAIEPVPAIIPAQDFFQLLSEKKFPCANFIRNPDEIDYLQEPDIFHEIYGHCPLLTNDAYANYMQEYGKLALSVQGKMRMKLFRLFWFTIEFGLLKENDNYRAYGGGILSSTSETVYAIDSEKAERIHLEDPLTALRTPYRIDILQPVYFVLNNLDHLFKLLEYDLVALAEKAIQLGDFEPKFPPKEVPDTKEDGLGC